MAECWPRLATAEDARVNKEVKCKLYVDGATNEIRSGAGVMLTSPESRKITLTICLKFKVSNNEAEYGAPIA